MSKQSLPTQIKQYLIITANYWTFTLTDGALRMLVVLYFHQLGYSPLNIALLFLFYEVFGVITNLFGGWLGAKFGLNKTMNIGLSLQLVALAMLLVPQSWLSVLYVMGAQALSGIAKDLNKMSAKSAIKLLVPEDAQGTLFKWVALLTGSKNALKGIGFFIGGLLLTLWSFQVAVVIMLVALALVWLFSIFALKEDLGKSKNKAKFSQLFSKSVNINVLSAARLFLFGARDVWFVVALPVYMATTLAWDHWWVGGFMAAWIVGYGIVQTLAPYITGTTQQRVPNGRSAVLWASALAIIPAGIAMLLSAEVHPAWVLVGGLLLFGVIFAINSSLHSYLIVSYASRDGVSMDIGFYYMANAMGRLIGTVASGWIFQQHGLVACLWASCVSVILAVILSLKLPNNETRTND